MFDARCAQPSPLRAVFALPLVHSSTDLQYSGPNETYGTSRGVDAPRKQEKGNGGRRRVELAPKALTRGENEPALRPRAPLTPSVCPSKKVSSFFLAIRFSC